MDNSWWLLNGATPPEFISILCVSLPLLGDTRNTEALDWAPFSPTCPSKQHPSVLHLLYGVHAEHVLFLYFLCVCVYRAGNHRGQKRESGLSNGDTECGVGGDGEQEAQR